MSDVAEWVLDMADENARLTAENNLLRTIIENSGCDPDELMEIKKAPKVSQGGNTEPSELQRKKLGS